MTIQSKILAALQRTDRLCDDCLSEMTGVRPRQAINQIARGMKSAKLLSRPTEDCARCRRPKIVNRLGDAPREPSPPPRPAETRPGRPWYWEGNVQRKIVEFLRADGYTVHSEADTATRQPGKDIVASTREGKSLWVTVKGFPESSPNTQARHWFAGAFHDVSRYRTESKDALLAMGLPAGFKTYEGLVKKDVAVRSFLGYSVYWVHADGAVTVQKPGE
jgi:hypothetical protein